jgi:hypothetical protein
MRGSELSSVASRPTGVVFATALQSVSVKPPKPVAISPGATAFTRTAGASARAIDSVSVPRAALDAA